MASHAYRVVLTGSTFLPRQHLSMHVRNHSLSIYSYCSGIHDHRLGICDPRLSIRDRHVGINRQLGLKRGAKYTSSGRNRLNVR